MLTEHDYISGGYVDIYESNGAPTRTRTADLLITNLIQPYTNQLLSVLFITIVYNFWSTSL